MAGTVPFSPTTVPLVWSLASTQDHNANDDDGSLMYWNVSDET